MFFVADYNNNKKVSCLFYSFVCQGEAESERGAIPFLLLLKLDLVWNVSH